MVWRDRGKLQMLKSPKDLENRYVNDLRRFAALDPFFNLEGFVVTAVFNFDPGFAAR